MRKVGYNGETWPDTVQKGLESFVLGGGGLKVIRSANNAFEGWPEWNNMIGLGWRKSAFGERLTIDESGTVVRTSRGEGSGGPRGGASIQDRDP